MNLPVLSPRQQAALTRLGKLVVIATAPVLVASLNAGSFDLHATEIALAVAALGAVEKFWTWSDQAAPAAS